ncbi:DUF4062 domain-containing protein [Paenibacillus sp. NPDC058174]|uniref:DUF4062 domain-containing protein n=1 Tax=Paenibacillus sp. NPDC058174 TaxID=3346366 RepID=UPI0036DE9F86
MRKKLQVYISSTFNDLVEERHAAVQAVLHAGHIPAGIEQFAKESPLSTLKRWISESDVYILILGGLYGLMFPDESQSYTHWEYDYAGELGKPRFAFVLTDEALRQKPYDFTQNESYEKYQAFKQSVFENIPVFHVEDERHIHRVIRGELPQYAEKLPGWFSGKDIPDVQRLQKENAELRAALERLQRGRK